MRAIALLALFVFAGCPSTAPVPAMISVADAQENALLAQGHKVFTESCGSCHGHPDVMEKTAAEWPATAKRMGSKADLTDAETEAVTRFILAARARAEKMTP